MTPLEFAVLILATWRASAMLSREEGPGDLFGWLRRSVGALEAINSGWVGTNWLAKLVICPLCLSVWIAALFMLLWNVEAIRPIIVLLAISGGACILEIGVRR